MAFVDPWGKIRQSPESMELSKFYKLVTQAWIKGHPNIPMMALGSKNFDNNKVIITYHLQRREVSSHTKKPRKTESFNTQETKLDLQGLESTIEKNVITSRQDFENVVTFTIHVPTEKGGGEIAELLREEFERFMVEHTPLFMKLGARNLTYYRGFYDDSLLKELSTTSARRFVAYTVYTQIVTETSAPVLQSMEAELRVALDDYNEVLTIIES